MAYNEFTLESAEADLAVTIRRGHLFPYLEAEAVSPWLKGSLERGMKLALLSEKARSEFIVAPILLAVRELLEERVAILSGQRLDVDPVRRLLGECDFILMLSDALPRLRAPILTVVEAKKIDIEAGLGQCVAEMVGAHVFNERAGKALPIIGGCVTTGEDWQFLRLADGTVTIDQGRFYIDNVGGILAALRASIKQAANI